MVRMDKKIFFIAIIAIGILSVPLFVFSEEEASGTETTAVSDEIQKLNIQIAEKQNKIRQIEKNIEDYKKKIEQKRLEAVSLSNQMSILDNRIVQVELDMEVTQQKLDILILEIEQLEIEINGKNKIIERQKEIIAEMIRRLHQNTDKNYIEVLAAYDSFSDFYNSLQYLETAEENIGQNIKSLQLAKTELENKKGETSQRKTAYDKLKQDLQEKKKDLEEDVFGKETLLAQTHASELTFKSLVDTLRTQYEDIENEIQNIEQEVRKKLEVQNKILDAETDDEFLFLWPAPSKYVTAYFHDPDYPFRHVFEHNAIDIRAAQGTEIRAASSGYIARARKCTLSSCYSYVMVVHSGGFSTVYGHLSKIIVNEDQFVAKGDVIAYSGGTPGTAGAGPFVTGPHLHFEVRKNGIPVNPLAYLPN